MSNIPIDIEYRIGGLIQWIQKDGTPAHAAHASRRWIKERFGQNFISLKETFKWFPHSPHLNLCDFFSLGTPERQCL